jgi:hypothetical protein
MVILRRQHCCMMCHTWKTSVRSHAWAEWAGLDSFLNQGQSCMGLPSAHVQHGRIIQQLSGNWLQPVCVLLLSSVLQQSIKEITWRWSMSYSGAHILYFNL